MKNKFTGISFFTGAGGLDMGFVKAGFDIKLCVEIEDKYCSTLKENHPEWNVHRGDIMDYDKDRVYLEARLNKNEKIDLIIGGSPCQSFSTAGKRQAFDDPRGKAMIKYAELIKELQPKVFVLENVKGLLSASLKHRELKERGEGFPPLTEEEEPKSALKYLMKKFKYYHIKVYIINAADYGVAQKRERVFIVGVRENFKRSFNFPQPTHNKDGSDGKQQWVTISTILEELSSEVDNHDYVKYSAERLKYMRMIPKGGGNWRDLPDDVVKEAMGGAYNSGGGKVGFYRRVKIDQPAPTLLTSPIQKSTNLGHPFEDRPLSIQEYLKIQGFPLDYKLSGTLNDQYTQIGNAVPVQLAQKIGNAIYNFLK